MKVTLKCDAVLEPELRELCSELTAVQRAQAAEKFIRWADQLTESVVLMDPQLIPRVAPPKVPRGFILMNMAKWRHEQLRQRAKACGVNWSSVLAWAITTVLCELEEKQRMGRMAGIEPYECWRFVKGDSRN